MTEAELLAATIDLAQLLRYRVAHFRPAKTAYGWRTPVQGDGKGWPDLSMVRGGSSPRLLFAELKSDTGRLDPEQVEWLAALEDSGCETYVWRPIDFNNGTIAEILRRAT